MLRFSFRSVIVAGTFIIATSAISTLFAQNYDYSHRKSAGKIATSKPGATIHATLIRNHFGFGGSINYWGFDTLVAGTDGVTQNYGDAFKQYFDYATPENEMKWPSNQYDTVEIEPYYGLADSIVSFCTNNDIKVRAHNLFWNEKTDWIPKYTKNLGTADFKAAMAKRIESAMTHWKGQVAQWDIINEIIHGKDGSTPTSGLLETMSGDPNIFSWILEEARKIDNTVPFVINDYSMETSDPTIDKYVAKCKPLASKFDIVGVEGHYGDKADLLTKNTVDTKVSKIVTGLNKKVWFTEVDWSFSISQSPAKMEELMRTCFANKNVDGLVLWVWAKRKMWRDLSSYLVDSLLVETPTGKKWKDVRKEWKTDTTVTADANGEITLAGYQGKYRLVAGDDTSIVYLYPENKTEILVPFSTTGIKTGSVQSRMQSATIRLNGKVINLSIPTENKSLYLSTFSISGKLISKIPLSFNNGTASIANLPSGCHTYRIGTADKTYYSGLGMDVR
jgi:GH35 family endo-1,4-beta-xylanase